MAIPVRPLGKEGLKASAQGLGLMGMTFAYKDDSHSEQEKIATIHRALELGISFMDSAEMYGPLTNEVLLGKAFKGNRDAYTIATKFGVINGAYDASPEAVQRSVAGSLERLGIDCIDLYYLHRVDPKTKIEDTAAAMGQLVKEGKIKYVGLSEVTADEIRRAHAVFPVTAVQLEWSLFTRDAEEDIIPTCRELGIGIVAYSPLGRGMLTGAYKDIKAFDPSDNRVNFPRFQEWEKNMALVQRVEKLAEKKGCTPGQLALAWVHHQGEDVFPIPGTKRVKYLEENIAAFHIKLTLEEMKELEAAVPISEVAGARYAPAAMQATAAHRAKATANA